MLSNSYKVFAENVRKMDLGSLYVEWMVGKKHLWQLGGQEGL